MAQFKAPLLQPFIRRLRFESFLKALFLGLATGVVAAFATMVVMWVIGVTNWIVPLAMFAGGLLIGGIVGYCFIYRLSLKDIIRRVDEAGLQERVTTMEELWGDMSYVAKLQRQDTLRRIKDLKPRTIHLALPLIAGIVLLAVSVMSVAAAFVPHLPSRVTADEPIFDNYQVIIPSINNLPDKLYQKVDQLPEELPETLRDQLNDIIKDIEDLNNGIKDGLLTDDMDNVADLDEVIDRLDQILDSNVKGPLLSDFMKNYPILSSLANALKSGNEEEVHKALYAWNFGFKEQLTEVLKTVEKSDASPSMKTELTLKLTDLISRIGNISDSFGSDRKLILELKNSLTAEKTTIIFTDKSVEVLLGTYPAFKPLSDALISGDSFAVDTALTALEATLKNAETNTINKAEVDALVAILAEVMDVTVDRPTGNGQIDPAWTAVQNLHGNLSAVSVLAGDPEGSDLARLAETFVNASADFVESVSLNTQNRTTYDNVITMLDYIYTGRYLYAYFWNDPANAAYIPEMGEGIAAVLRRAIAIDCGISEYYKDAPLVNAFYSLIAKLETAAKNAVQNGGAFDTLNDLFGATRPVPGADQAPHEKHKEKNAIPVACNEISAALIVEKEIQDVIEDMKGEIKDTIDDLLNPDGEEEPKPGMDSKPPDQPSGGTPPEGSDQPSEGDQPPQEESPPQSGGGGSSTGKEDLSGMTFFNPNTQREEELTEETLAQFGAALEEMLNDPSYSDEEKKQMDLYYEYLLQKFSKN